MVILKKTTLDLFNNALAELEQIVAELEINEDSANGENLDESLTEFEPNIANLESQADLTAVKNQSAQTIK